MNNNIILPTPQAGLVKIDLAEEKIGSLYLAEQDKKEPDTGIVTAGPEDLIGKRVRFREHFGERIVINGEAFLWFAELLLSIYYIIEDED